MLVSALGAAELGIGIYGYGTQLMGNAWIQGGAALMGTQAAYDIATDPGVRQDFIAGTLSDPNGVRATGELLGAGASGLVRTGVNTWNMLKPGIGEGVEQFLYRSGGLAYAVPPLKAAKPLPQMVSEPVQTTVIGRMPHLERFANDSLVDTWAKSGRIPGIRDGPVLWPENEYWLIERILRGDKFGIATDPATLPGRLGYKIGQANGYFTWKELDFLQRMGIDVTPMY